MRLKIFGATLTVMLLLFSNGLSAQSYAESALQFSRTMPTGSARIQALGGAQVALGGDYSSTLSNPAGLGLYNKSELTISTAFNSFNTASTYRGNNESDFKNSLNFPGLSVVLHFPKANDGNGFLGGTFGLSMSRINDFNQSIFYKGTNNNSSIIDSFIGIADSYGDSEFSSPDQIFDEGQPEYNTPTGLAYYNFLIGPKDILDEPGSPREYFTDVVTVPEQQESVRTRGHSNQWSFSYGGNYSDKIFFGAAIGLTTLNYKNTKTYSENFPGNNIFSNLNLNENLSVKGTGINATLGVMGRPVNFIQVGMSFTTPTVFQLSEKYDASMSTNWKDYDYWDGEETITLENESANTDIVTSDYSLVTPLKFSTGIAFISKYGFITGDIELTNLARAKYSSDTEGLSFSDANREIKSTYRSVINYRIGAEFRYDIFRVRAGYGVQANPYRNKFDIDTNISSISGGVGIRIKKIFVDFALINSRGDNLYSPYDGGSTVELKNSLTKGLVTFGFTF
jgi:hypothetical protein